MSGLRSTALSLGGSGKGREVHGVDRDRYQRSAPLTTGPKPGRLNMASPKRSVPRQMNVSHARSRPKWTWSKTRSVDASRPGLLHSRPAIWTSSIAIMGAVAGGDVMIAASNPATVSFVARQARGTDRHSHNRRGGRTCSLRQRRPCSKAVRRRAAHTPPPPTARSGTRSASNARRAPAWAP